MKKANDESFDRWLCQQTRNLLKTFNVESASVVLGRTTDHLKKTYDVNDARHLTLPNMVTLERELVAIGLEPVFSIAHLKELGYSVKKNRVTPSDSGPAACLMDMVPATCDHMKEMVLAAEDGKITMEEHQRILNSYADLKCMMETYERTFSEKMKGDR